MKGNIDNVRELNALDIAESNGAISAKDAAIRRIELKRAEDPTYIGSERHFQDLQRAAGKTTASGHDREPETLEEAAADFCAAWDDLMKALGIYRFADRVLVAIGKLLIKMGWKQ